MKLRFNFWILTLFLIEGLFSPCDLAAGNQVADPTTKTAPNPSFHTAQGTGVDYYLSLPEGWTPSKTWPILVDIEGSGHHFQSSFEMFVKTRKDLPFVIVTPCVVSNGNDPAEEVAFYDLVRQVQTQVHGQPKFFLTGFSAGGHLNWKVVFAHPELLAGAAPASAAYLGRGVTDISNAPERVRLPIRAFQGQKDSTLKYRDAQWTVAQTLAQEHGYENVSRTLVPDTGHSPCVPQVVAFFASLLRQ